VKLLLHIGGEKTGSTSIQELLERNVTLAEKHKIYFPMQFGGGNCHELVTAFKTDNCVFWGDLGLTQVQELEKRFSICRKFQDYLETLPEDAIVVLSSEFFSSQLARRVELLRLHSYLTRYFSQVRVLIFIRDQATLAEGLTWEHLKGGGLGYPLWEPSPENLDNPYFNYKRLLLNWREVFGETNLCVLNFREKRRDLKRCLEIEIQQLSKRDFVFQTDISYLNLSPGFFSYETLRVANSLIIKKIGIEDQDYPFKPNVFFSQERQEIIKKIVEQDVYHCRYRVNRRAWFEAFKELNSWVESEIPNLGTIFLASTTTTEDLEEMRKIGEISKAFASEYVSTIVGTKIV
jgi:hypothetical protein